MYDTLTLTEIRSINRQLAELKQMLNIDDIVNRKTALEILDIDSKTLTNYIGQGKVRVVSRNAAGQAFFSRKELLGL